MKVRLRDKIKSYITEVEALENGKIFENCWPDYFFIMLRNLRNRKSKNISHQYFGCHIYSIFCGITVYSNAKRLKF